MVREGLPDKVTFDGDLKELRERGLGRGVGRGGGGYEDSEAGGLLVGG